MAFHCSSVGTKICIKNSNKDLKKSPNHLKISPIPFIISLNHCTRPVKPSDIALPISLKKFPIVSPNDVNASVKPFQKSLKKLPTVVASSLILLGIELTASQILSRIPVLSFPLSGLLGSVAPPPCPPPSVLPSEPEELPEKPIHL